MWPFLLFYSFFLGVVTVKPFLYLRIFISIVLLAVTNNSINLNLNVRSTGQLLHSTMPCRYCIFSSWHLLEIGQPFYMVCPFFSAVVRELNILQTIVELLLHYFLGRFRAYQMRLGFRPEERRSRLPVIVAEC